MSVAEPFVFEFAGHEQTHSGLFSLDETRVLTLYLMVIL